MQNLHPMTLFLVWNAQGLHGWSHWGTHVYLGALCLWEVAFLGYCELYSIMPTAPVQGEAAFHQPAFVAKGHTGHKWNFIQWTEKSGPYENSLSSRTVCWGFSPCRFPWTSPGEGGALGLLCVLCRAGERRTGLDVQQQRHERPWAQRTPPEPEEDGWRVWKVVAKSWRMAKERFDEQKYG